MENHYPISIAQRTNKIWSIKKNDTSITEKMLAQQLKQLEFDRLIIRDAKEIIPPHVEYSLSESGKTLLPILTSMAEWGQIHNPILKSCEV